MATLRGVGNVEDLLALSLTLLERNNRLLANNIANIDTPNFRPTHLDFQESLRRTLRSANSASAGTATRGAASRKLRLVMEEDGIECRNDGNYTDVETEMMKLAENTSKYNLYASLLTKKFQVMKRMLTTLK